MPNPQPVTPGPAAPDFLFAVPITKVDAEKREVTGILNEEILDKVGDVTDFAHLKTALEATWPGNIREQHDAKKAVGTRVDLVFEPELKRAVLTARVSKGAPDTWEKVLDGTLKGYSFGGSGRRVTEKTVDGRLVNRLYIDQVAEVSLVDNPACPTALFTLVKSVDGQMADVQPKEPAMPIEKRTIPQADLDDAKDSDFAGPDRSYPILEPADVAAAAQALGRAKGGAAARAKIKARIIAIAKKKGAEFEAKLPKAWRDGAADEKALEADCFKAASDVLPEPWDIERILTAINLLESILANEAWSAAAAAADGREAAAAAERAQIDLLRQAIAYALEFLFSEYEEQFETAAAEGAEPIAMAATVDLAKATAALILKVGRRNSKADLETIQAMHDSAVKLGAVCTAQKAGDGGDATKAVLPPTAAAPEPQTPTPPSPAPVESESPAPAAERVTEASAPAPVEDSPVVKAVQDHLAQTTDALTKALTTLEEQKATIAAQAGSLAQLEERIAAIEAQPAPGGPVTRVVPVEKTLGGASAAPAPSRSPAASPTGDGDEVLKAFDTLANASRTESERLELAHKKLAYMRQTRQ